jgi:hypothetical protein
MKKLISCHHTLLCYFILSKSDAAEKLKTRFIFLKWPTGFKRALAPLPIAYEVRSNVISIVGHYVYHYNTPKTKTPLKTTRYDKINIFDILYKMNVARIAMNIVAHDFNIFIYRPYGRRIIQLFLINVRR